MLEKAGKPLKPEFAGSLMADRNLPNNIREDHIDMILHKSKNPKRWYRTVFNRGVKKP